MQLKTTQFHCKLDFRRILAVDVMCGTAFILVLYVFVVCIYLHTFCNLTQISWNSRVKHLGPRQTHLLKKVGPTSILRPSY